MDAVSQIKQKLDIVDVVGSYVPIKKMGKSYKGACPFHNEDTPSFVVSSELQIFKCFGCNAAGDMFSFVEKIEGVDFISALEILAEKAGVTLEKNDINSQTQLKQRIYYINELTAKFYNYLLTRHVLGKEGLEYFVDKRKLSAETIREFMLGYAPQRNALLIDFLSKKNISIQEMLAAGVIVKKIDGVGYVDKFRGRVIFPFVNVGGKYLGFAGRTIFDRKPKYVNTSETLVYHKSSFLYGLQTAKLAIKKKGAVLVEGYMDLISAYQGGFDNLVASSGTAVTQEQLELLARYTKDIVFCLDADAAGVSAVFRAVDLAEKQDFNIKAAVMPEGSKDIDELLNKDKNAVTEMFSHTVPAYDYFISSVLKKYDKRSPNGKKQIIEDLAPKFSDMQNKVLLDHYSSEIAGYLDLDKETVQSMFSSAVVKKWDRPKSPELVIETFTQKSNSTPEHYLMSLLLRAGLDKMKSTAALLSSEDFTVENLGIIFDRLLYYTRENQSFDINEFTNVVNTDLQDLVRDLYLMENYTAETDSPEAYQELDLAVRRTKKESVKRKIKVLGDKLRLAEMENNDKLISDISNELNALSKELY